MFWYVAAMALVTMCAVALILFVAGGVLSTGRKVQQRDYGAWQINDRPPLDREWLGWHEHPVAFLQSKEDIFPRREDYIGAWDEWDDEWDYHD